MEIIVAPEEIEVRVVGGVVVATINTEVKLQLFFGSHDSAQITKILDAIYEVRAKEMGM